MGYYNERYIEFCETHQKFEEDSDKFEFALEVYDALIKANQKEIDLQLKEFLYDIFKELNGNEIIWAMASAGSLAYNFSFSSVGEALIGLQALTEKDVNLYFSPAVFTGWRKDKNVTKVHTIYIDIDDVDGVDFSLMNEESVRRYLLTMFKLTEEMLPNWLVCSGHGLHLYYLVEGLDMQDSFDSELRLRYTDYLITYFGADVACRNKSRILRFPNSRNIKNLEDIRLTQLYHLNMSADRSIQRLNYFAMPQEAIDVYMADCKARRSEKRKQTMIANGTYKAKHNKPSKRADRVKVSGVEIVATKKSNDKPWIAQHSELKVNLTPLSEKARYRRILRDLHNYAARRGGVPKGFRAIFTHIMAEILFRMYLTEFDAKYFIEKYIDREFLPEAEIIVKSVFSTPKRYMYRNERIAELLGFGVEEFNDAFASYTDKQKQAARKKAVSKYDIKRYREKRALRQKEQEYRIEYIKNHTEETTVSLAKKFRCSVRTIQYIRATIRKEIG